MLNRRQITASLAFAGLGLRNARAQPRLATAKLLCGFPAGGTTDAVSRRVAERLQGDYAGAAIVENKPGAGGRLAVEELKRSANDGSVMLMTPAAMITLYPHLYRKLPYRADEFSPVCTVCQVAFGFGVGPAVPAGVKTINDYLAWAKATPKDASYGSPGAGSPPHMLGALLGKESGVDLNHVPYRGSAPGIQDLLGGQLPAMTSPIGDYLPYLKSGKLRLLATSGAARSRFVPDVPTYAEQGLKTLTMSEWYGFFLPGGASAEVVNRAAAAVRNAVANPVVVEAFAQLGLEAGANTPAELAKAVKEENAAWGPIVQRVGFKPED